MQTRSAQEETELREALNERLEELREEHRRVVLEMETLQRERLADSAGDDQGDSGSKTIEHEQEITVANTIAEKVYQVERALDRLDVGDWGICERCGKPIPAARLAVFPSATQCVACKQLDERR
ncbi:TraR/DksA family transcriptional regulator [Natronoglycomyces albus]|uniref:TraR/DksA family transcriptional regulator n=1 Tax=Natronoglycomyces albus TaxID=2811108 RepID=A0A895XXW7_9ACTN|nr:TraR/DksA family transcriptional regulator [Natronoglycomyces albus]